MVKFEVEAPDGVRIPLTWFPASQPRWVCLFLPALGIQARFYNTLAAALAANGCSVCLFEQRGLGESTLRAGRSVQFGIADYLDKDIPAALSRVRAETPGLPVLLGGHSLGGHLSTLYCGREGAGIAGVFHIACGFPYHADFPPRTSRLIRMLCFLIPWFRVVPGYFPGRLVGFAGRESLKLMLDWRDWARTGSFDFGGHKDVAAPAARFTGPVLSIAIENDEFCSERARERALTPFRSAQVTRLTLGREEQGEFLGHFSWARQPDGVVRTVMDWMETIPARDPVEAP